MAQTKKKFVCKMFLTYLTSIECVLRTFYYKNHILNREAPGVVIHNFCLLLEIPNGHAFLYIIIYRLLIVTYMKQGYEEQSII